MACSERDLQIIGEIEKPSIEVIYTRYDTTGNPTHVAFKVSVTWKNNEYPVYNWDTRTDKTEPDFPLVAVVANKYAVLVKMFNKISDYKANQNILNDHKTMVSQVVDEVWGV
jgi:hypothetical protein